MVAQLHEVCVSFWLIAVFVNAFVFAVTFGLTLHLFQIVAGLKNSHLSKACIPVYFAGFGKILNLVAC
jgi:hypothetical protein